MKRLFALCAAVALAGVMACDTGDDLDTDTDLQMDEAPVTDPIMTDTPGADTMGMDTMPMDTMPMDTMPMEDTTPMGDM